MKQTLRILLWCALAATAASCASEYSVANAYLRKFERQKANAVEQIYVCLPTTVAHTNSALNDIKDFYALAPRQQDSVIASLTHILDKLDDSIFLSQFGQSLLYTLSRTHIPIVVVSGEEHLPPADSTHLIVHVVQMEAEEYLQPSRSDFTTRGGAYYAYDYDLRHFSANAWLRLGAMDTLLPVVFSNYEVADRFRGTVTRLRNQTATLETHFERIGPNDAYLAARILGETCARLFVERLLVSHVRAVKGSNQYYFLYSPGYNDINYAVDYEEGMRDSFLPVPAEPSDDSK